MRSARRWTRSQSAGPRPPAAPASCRRSCSTRAASGSIAFRGKSECCSSARGPSYVRSITLTVQFISPSFPAGPVFSQALRSVSSRRDSRDTVEHRGEVARGPESPHLRDPGDGRLPRRQEGAGTGDPLPDDESMRRQAGAALEKSRKVVGAHVDHGRELGEPQVFVEVLLDVLDHPPESAPGDGADVPSDGYGPS